jgi:uncharacterized membrane protein
MVSFDYSGLDAAILAACVVLYALITAVVLLAVGWLTQRQQKKWLWSARNWLRCSLGISTVFLVAFVAAEVGLLWRGVRVDPYMLAWPLIWLSLAVVAVLRLRRNAAFTFGG